MSNYYLMPTFKQLGYKGVRVGRKVPNHVLDLEKCPQKRGTCYRVFLRTPKKPCSAKRATAKIYLNNNRRTCVMVHIPGEGHNLKKHGIVLIRGAPVPDLPGVKYRVIRNVNKGQRWIAMKRKPNRLYSLLGLSTLDRYRARSKFGVGSNYRVEAQFCTRRKKMKVALEKLLFKRLAKRIYFEDRKQEYLAKIKSEQKFKI